MTIAAAATRIEILLVEDNPGDVRLAREALRDADMRNNVHVAGDGVEALAFLHREGRHQQAPRPALILLDWNLPRKSGREVLDAIKRDEALRGIPVVILTTSQAEGDIVAGYRLGANAYVTKPMDLEEFLRVVQSIEKFWLKIVTVCPP